MTVIGQTQQKCIVDKSFVKTQSNTIQLRESNTVTLVFHICKAFDEASIPDELIISQLAQLNADFNATNDDIDMVPEIFQSDVGQALIEFRLAQQTPDGNETNGILRYDTDVANIIDQKSTDGKALIKFSALGGADAWDTKSYVNVWLGMGEDFLGAATGPNEAGEITDGIVLNTHVVGQRPDDPSPFNLGRTLTHELGHYFGLNHLWGSDQGCDTDDDGIEDTPMQAGPHEGCPEFPDISCGSADMTMNFMDFSNDACLHFFTKDQTDVMQGVLMSERASLLENNTSMTQDTFEDAFDLIHELDRITIKAKRKVSGISSLSIYDINGQLMQKETVNDLFFHTLNTNFYTTGVYILLIESSSIRKSVLFGKVN